MYDQILEFIAKYLPLPLAGMIGATVKRIRSRMTIKKFIGQLFISAFVSFCLGVILQYWLNIPNEIVYAIGGIIGVVSELILDEIESMVRRISVWVNLFFQNKAIKK